MNELVDKKLQELNAQKSEAEALIKIAEKYPDLQEHTNRWGTKFYTAVSANPDVTDYSSGHSCGCCNDAPLYFYPFLMIDGIKVHGGPIPFCIGRKFGYEDHPYDGWDTKLRDAKIPEAIISKVQEMFDEEERKGREYREYDD